MTTGVTTASGVTAVPGSGGGAVTQIVAGTNVTITPAGGTGAVTINATGGGSTGANPSAVVGLTAVNGAATTFLRSDGAPAIDQTITPTWTGKHTHSITMTANTANDAVQFTTSQIASAGNQIDSPALHFTGSGWGTTTPAAAAVEARMYLRPVQGTTNPSQNLIIDWSIAGSAFADYMTMGLGSNGTTTFLGALTVNGVRVQGATIPTNGIYLPGANQLGFSTNSTLRATIEATGQIRNVIIGAGYSTAEGTNGKQGVATLVAGTVTVSTTSVTAVSRIFLTAQSLGTVTTAKALAVTARTAGTSFVITSADATDTSVIAYEIFEPS